MKILILILILFVSKIQAQPTDNQVIILGVTSNHGKIDIVKSYFLLELIKNNPVDNRRIIIFNKKRYKIYPFEISVFNNSLKVCCNDSTSQNNFINDNGEPNYSLIFRNKVKILNKKTKYEFSKVKLSYCECQTYRVKNPKNITDLYCLPKKVLKNYKFTYIEKKVLRNNLRAFYTNPLVRQYCSSE